MTRDHYAVLGVSPTSEDVVIRAAYRALMRRYHPDADPSDDAALRAQAINAAYAVLGDPEKRARYDGSLAAQGLIKPEPPHRAGLARRLVPGPAGFIALAALAAAATMIILSPPIGVLPEDRLPLSAEPRPSRDPEPGLDRSKVSPSKAVPAAKEVPNAMLERQDEFVAPDMPEASPVRPAKASPPRPKTANVAIAPERPGTKLAVASRQEGPAVGATDARTDCRLGDGWADRAICGNSNLTALDRQQGLLYAQSLAKADETTRVALLGSRDRFQQKRNACRSENCLTSAYIARLREISDLMARGAQQ